MTVSRRLRHGLAAAGVASVVTASLLVVPTLAQPAPAVDPPEVTIGERLFLETRFAQFFATSMVNGNVNAPLVTGDAVVDFTETMATPLPGPFAGTSMNCRACHLVDEQLEMPGGGMRTYNDFARRSPIPGRADGHTATPRNSPPLVNASLPRDGGLLLHFDGEFTTLPDLVTGTLTGRNYGWQPREFNAAIAHVANVIRKDNGQGELAQEFGGLSYAVIFKGTDPSIPTELRLPKQYRLDVSKASDAKIVAAVATLIGVYTEQLVFSTDAKGNFNLSPYDVFLELNELPRHAKANESNRAYSDRLLAAIVSREAKGQLQFVNTNPNTTSGLFDFHPDQLFTFGPDELKGLKIFFNGKNGTLTPQQLSTGGIGNCVACHQAPKFTDFQLHNTGATQSEYDAVHGSGAFGSLNIPGLVTRLLDHDSYLPATPAHPDASGRFRAIPSAGNSELTDLGVWNVFANPDFPKSQTPLWTILCKQETGTAHPLQLLGNCNPATLLTKSIALFKTPGLRDLSHSAPYLHTGQFDTLEDVIALYRNSSSLARAGQLRNGAPELRTIALVPGDVAPLVSFLKSLNEDYN